MAGSALQITQPMSVKDIAVKADDFQFNTDIALKFWLRTADMLLREASIYEHEHNDQQAYLLLMRYATLVTGRIPTHPSARDPENRAGVRAAQKTIPIVIEKLELIKPRVTERYNAYQKGLERRRAAGVALGHDGSLPNLRLDFAASDPAVAGNTTTLAAADNRELAVKLAHKEIRRRDAARRGIRQAGVSEQEEQERRTAGLWDDWENALSKNGSSQDVDRPRRDDDLQANMEAARRRMDGTHDIVPDGVRKRLVKPTPRPVRPSPQNGSSDYRYPSVSKSQPLNYNASPIDSNTVNIPPHSIHLPLKPPKEQFETAYRHEQEPPSLPEKDHAAFDEPDVTTSKASASFTFRPSAYLENGKPLRTVFLNPTLRDRFLEVAAPNTRNNLETCGVLCGTLISNALFISRVVIPEQESTSDTCETVNEGALFDYCAKEDLMVLGWIHTHPTQTCFMSSRDLHTHSGYQTMMAESIAIVCAPSKDPSWGIFRLTDPPGMKCVLQCTKPGLFHPHSEPNIYTDALRPGHVFEAAGLEYGIVDLRP